ncbi:MAG: hypothetical protein HQK50_04725 [Oligoflexia bacterium]|nr:hypothetical protein [Oligoflexia bacterium]MBF0364850.1 hypothetical protein [Oligoflexia bacterium]
MYNNKRVLSASKKRIALRLQTLKTQVNHLIKERKLQEVPHVMIDALLMAKEEWDFFVDNELDCIKKRMLTEKESVEASINRILGYVEKTIGKNSKSRAVPKKTARVARVAKAKRAERPGKTTSKRPITNKKINQ